MNRRQLPSGARGRSFDTYLQPQTCCTELFCRRRALNGCALPGQERSLQGALQTHSPADQIAFIYTQFKNFYSGFCESCSLKLTILNTSYIPQ